MQTERVKFWQLVRGFLAQDLIFIDEAGVDLALTRLRARALQGRRSPQTPQQHTNDISAPFPFIPLLDAGLILQG